MPMMQWKMQNDYKPWYVGWANCDQKATEILRQYYQTPFFLPEDSAPGKKDWIFMGTPGFGAPFHLDNVEYPSWQAQVVLALFISSFFSKKFLESSLKKFWPMFLSFYRFMEKRAGL